MIPENSLDGCILEVDLEYPKELHELYNDFFKLGFTPGKAEQLLGGMELQKKKYKKIKKYRKSV